MSGEGLARSGAGDEGAVLRGVGAARQYLTMGCAGRTLGIDIMSVREIRRWSPTTPLPNQPFGATGVIDIRGNIVEVYDLAKLVGGVTTTAEDSAKVVVVVSLDTAEAALTVDTVSDIIFAESDEVREPPGGPAHNSGISALVRGKDRLVAILDLAGLLPAYANDPHVHMLS